MLRIRASHGRFSPEAHTHPSHPTEPTVPLSVRPPVRSSSNVPPMTVPGNPRLRQSPSTTRCTITVCTSMPTVAAWANGTDGSRNRLPTILRLWLLPFQPISPPDRDTRSSDGPRARLRPQPSIMRETPSMSITTTRPCTPSGRRTSRTTTHTSTTTPTAGAVLLRASPTASTHRRPAVRRRSPSLLRNRPDLDTSSKDGPLRADRPLRATSPVPPSRYPTVRR